MGNGSPTEDGGRTIDEKSKLGVLTKGEKFIYFAISAQGVLTIKLK
jgi:hypothetical protein